jgi:hypothetical protein
VILVATVFTLIQKETVRVDPERLGCLYLQLGEVGAEDVVCRAIEELAVRLAHSERLWRKSDYAGLRKCTRSLIAIAEQVGMIALARVSGDITIAIDNGDTAAVGATLFRLLRIGEKSLTAVWDLQDLSV